MVARMPRLSLDLLRAFHAAARQSSYTRAAAELSLTQSAISHGIRTLEDQLGMPLFKRAGRSVELTPAGTELYRAVDESLRLIDEATARVVMRKPRLAITVPVPIASMWLGPRLPGFTRLYPEIELSVSATNDSVDLEREQVDIAIRHALLRRGDPEPPVEQRLFDHLTFPVLSPTLSRKRPLKVPGDLEKHVLLFFESRSNGRPWVDWPWWFEAMNVREISGAGSLRFSHYEQVVQAALKGSGVAIGRLPHLVEQLSDGSLVAPLGRAGVARIGCFFVIVRPGSVGPTTEKFVAWLREQAEEARMSFERLIPKGRRP